MKIIVLICVIILGYIAYNVALMTHYQKADLERKLKMNATVDCYRLPDTGDVMGAITSRQQCLNEVHRIERKLDF